MTCRWCRARSRGGRRRSAGAIEARRRSKKVFLFLDNLGVHHCKPVKAWLTEHRRDIEAFFMSNYSLDLNPDEQLADFEARHRGHGAGSYKRQVARRR